MLNGIYPSSPDMIAFTASCTISPGILKASGCISCLPVGWTMILPWRSRRAQYELGVGLVLATASDSRLSDTSVFITPMALSSAPMMGRQNDITGSESLSCILSRGFSHMGLASFIVCENHFCSVACLISIESPYTIWQSTIYGFISTIFLLYSYVAPGLFNCGSM